MFVFASCDSKRIFEENKTIANNVWAQSDKPGFPFTITDTVAAYNIYLNVRNAGWYPFSNIFVFVSTRLPDGTLTRDTAEITLADKEGKWLGDGLGDIWDNQVLFKKDFRFSKAGDYYVELEQAMRVKLLPGIMDAGIRIEKNK